jgi:hypothetical protein
MLPWMELAAMVELYGSGEDQLIPFPNFSFEPGLPRPGAGDHPGIVLNNRLKDPQSRSGGDNPSRPDPAPDAHVHPLP